MLIIGFRGAQAQSIELEVSASTRKVRMLLLLVDPVWVGSPSLAMSTPRLGESQIARVLAAQVSNDKPLTAPVHNSVKESSQGLTCFQMEFGNLV